MTDHARSLAEMLAPYADPHLHQIGRFVDVPPAIAEQALLLLLPEQRTERPNMTQPPMAWLVEKARELDGRLVGSLAHGRLMARLDGVQLRAAVGRELAARVAAAWPPTADTDALSAVAEAWESWSAERPIWVGIGVDLLADRLPSDAPSLVSGGTERQQAGRRPAKLSLVSRTFPGMTAENGTDGSRRLAARSELLRGGGWLSLTDLAARRGDTDVGLTGSWAYAQLRDGALLVLSGPDRSIIVPAFQLTESGEPRPELRPLLEELRGGRIDGWTAWAWLMRPSNWLSGEVPEQLAVTNPARARLAAARFAAAARPPEDPPTGTRTTAEPP